MSVARGARARQDRDRLRLDRQRRHGHRLARREGRRQGLRLLPANLERAKARGCRALGAKVCQLDGNYDEANRACRELAEATGMEFANITLRPFYAEGAKTPAFEIVEQLDWRSPDHIVMPAAGGTLSSRVSQGPERAGAARACETAGPASTSPSRPAAPRSRPRSPRTARDRPPGAGDAGPLAGDRRARATARWSSTPCATRGGTAAAVPDGEIITAMELLAATEGVLTEPAGGTTLGGDDEARPARPVRPRRHGRRRDQRQRPEDAQRAARRPWPENVPCNARRWRKWSSTSATATSRPPPARAPGCGHCRTGAATLRVAVDTFPHARIGTNMDGRWIARLAAIRTPPGLDSVENAARRCPRASAAPSAARRIRAASGSATPVGMSSPLSPRRPRPALERGRPSTWPRRSARAGGASRASASRSPSSSPTSWARWSSPSDSDPELWQRIMDRFFAILSEGVHRFEGTVDKFTGDGIMALFGAPIAHEDHARRACYAALHLSDELAAYAAELRRDAGAQLLRPHRHQLGRGRRRRDRRGPRHGVHRRRPHGRPRPAHGAARRAGQGVSHRAHGGARPGLPRRSRTSASSRSRAPASRCASTS